MAASPSDADILAALDAPESSTTPSDQDILSALDAPAPDISLQDYGGGGTSDADRGRMMRRLGLQREQELERRHQEVVRRYGHGFIPSQDTLEMALGFTRELTPNRITGIPERAVEGVASEIAGRPLELKIKPTREIGRAVNRLGELASGAVEDIAVQAVSPANEAAPEYSGNFLAAMRGEPRPYQEAVKGVGGVPEWLSKVSTVISHTAPQLLIQRGLVKGGVAEAPAAGLSFGWTPEGYDPKAGAIMAAFPGVAQIGEKLALETAGKYLSGEAAQAVAGQAGSYAAAQAYLDLTSLPDYATMSPEEAKDAWAQNFGVNLAFHLAKVPGLTKPVLADIQEAVRQRGFNALSSDVALETARRAGLPRQEPRPAQAGTPTAEEFIQRPQTTSTTDQSGTTAPPIASGEVSPKEEVPKSPGAGDLIEQKTGWTFEGEQRQGMSPEAAAQLPPEQQAQLSHDWAFTDRRPDSPTYTATVYLPIGVSPEQGIELINTKAAEVVAADRAHQEKLRKEKANAEAIRSNQGQLLEAGQVTQEGQGNRGPNVEQTAPQQPQPVAPREERQNPPAAQEVAPTYDPWQHYDFDKTKPKIAVGDMVLFPVEIQTLNKRGREVIKRLKDATGQVVSVTEDKGLEVQTVSDPNRVWQPGNIRRFNTGAFIKPAPQPEAKSFAETVTPPGERGRVLRPAGKIAERMRGASKRKSVERQLPGMQGEPRQSVLITESTPRIAAIQEQLGQLRDRFQAWAQAKKAEGKYTGPSIAVLQRTESALKAELESLLQKERESKASAKTLTELRGVASAKPKGKIAERMKPKGDAMASLMERIAAKEKKAAAPQGGTPTAAKASDQVAELRSAMSVKAARTAAVEAHVPAEDRVVARAGIDPVKATPAQKIEAGQGYAMVGGKWQKVTPELSKQVSEQVRTLNQKRLRNLSAIKDYASRMGFKPTDEIYADAFKSALGPGQWESMTLQEFITRTEAQIRKANEYVDGVRDQAAISRRGIVSGSKAEQWADQKIEEGKRRLFTGIDPELFAALGIKGVALLERGLRDFGAWSTEMVRALGENISPHLHNIWENALALEADPERYEATLRLVKRAQAGLVTAQIPEVQRSVALIKAEIALRNTQGHIILKGEALDRQRAWDRVASHPFIRKFFIEPVDRMMEIQRIMDGAFTNYRDLKADPNADPTVVSGAAGVAVDTLDRFYTTFQSFRGKYAEKVKKLSDQLEATNEAKVERGGEVEVYDQLLQDFIDIGKEMMRQNTDTGAAQAWRKALGHSGAIRNVLGFMSRHVSLTEDSSTGVLKQIEAAAQPFLGEQRGIEQVVGATKDVIAEVARYVAAMQPIRARLKEGKEMLDEAAQTVPLSDFKNELADQIRAANWDAAMQLFVRGVGKTATERDASKKAANFFKAQERNLLIQLQALQQAKGLVETSEASPEFRSLATEAYRDLNVRVVIRGQDGTSITLAPVFDEPPTRISFDTNRIAVQKNLEELKAYRDRALVYLSDPLAEGYDPRKAAALQAFLEDQEQLLNPAVNPAAGKLMEAWPRRVYRTIFGFLGRPDLIPQFALDRTAGMASELAHRTLNAYSTIGELKTAILKQHHQKLRLMEAQAMAGHGMTGDVERYRDQVWTPLAASQQYFENTNPLRAGMAIGNGQTVTREDMTYFHAVRSFEQDVMNTAGGVGARAFAAIQQNPGGILYNSGGRTYIRMPFETGPGTVHRRLRGRMTRWMNEWEGLRTPEEKVDFLNRNLDRLIFGYINDVGNPQFKFDYRYGPELRQIMAEGKAGNPVSSFADLVERILEKAHEVESEEEVAPTADAVAQVVLDEFGKMFERYRKFDPAEVNGKEKSIVEAFGGENSFNTERGSQIVPSLWYDYGSVSLAERLGYLHNSTVSFAIEHFRAVQALDRVLKNVVQRFKDRGYDEGMTRSEQLAGEDFYNWGEAERLSRDVTHYLADLERALSYQVKVPQIGTRLDPASQANVGLGFIVASLLTSASANIMNTFGGGLNITLFDQVVRNRGFVSAVASNGVKAVARILRDTLHVMSSDKTPVGKALYAGLSHAQTKPLIGGVAEAALKYLTSTKEFYDLSRKIGLNLNTDLANVIASEWRWRGSGGIDAQAPDSKVARLVIKPLEAMVRMVTEATKQGTVGFVDSRLNATGILMAQQLELDLMRRAVEYGSKREERALAGNWNPDDITDLRNRWSSKELVGGRLPDGAAIRLRDLMRRHGDINVDAAMHSFYRKWVEAGRPDLESGESGTPVAPMMLSEAQRNQLSLAIGADVNQATFANRPIAVRSSKTGANLGLFLGYPAFEMYKLASLADRISTKSVGRASLENLPMLIGTALTLTVLGSLAVGLSDEARRRLLKRQTPFPTIFNWNQNGKSWIYTLINGAAAMIPFWGAMANAAIGRAYKTGFDLNSQFMTLNLGTDGYRLMKELFQSGQYLRPLIKFASRWSFPMNWIAPHLHIMAGLNEVAQVRNSLSSSARQVGLEARLKAPFSAADVTYTKATGPANDFMNAVGNRDMPAAQKAFQELVKVGREQGRADPVSAAARAIQARNPVTQVFGAKPTPEEWQALVSVMRPEDARRVQQTMAFMDMAVQGVGGGAVAFVQQPSFGGGGGSSSVGAGGSGGYSGPSGGGSVVGAGGGASSVGAPGLGAPSIFRIRVPKLKSPRLSSSVGKIRARVGKSRVRKIGKIASRIRRR